MDYDSLLDLVKNRRSSRWFLPDPVPDEYIDKIIEVARWAPSGFNMQPWEFVVVKKPELRRKIMAYIGGYNGLRNDMETTREQWQGPKRKMKSQGDSKTDITAAPVLIILYGDSRTNVGLPMGVRFEPDRLNSTILGGLASAFLYMHLAATSLGLASKWASSIRSPYAHCMVNDLLGVPEYMIPYDMMELGYPAKKPGNKFLRDPRKMVHYDQCNTENFRTDEEVKDFVKRSRSWCIGMHRPITK